MIIDSAKQASERALEYFEELHRGRHFDLAVEEIEHSQSDDRDTWYVTVGYFVDAENPLKPSRKRYYKDIIVNGRTWEVESIKIKELA